MDDSLGNPTEPTVQELLALLREGDNLMHKACWAAGKLHSEMNLRRSMPSWAELEALTDQTDAMWDWKKRVRHFTFPKPKETA